MLLDWIGQKELAWLLALDAAICAALAVGMARRWPAGTTRWLGVATLVSYIAMLLGDPADLTGHTYPPVVVWPLSAAQAASPFICWIFLMSLWTAGFRLRLWYGAVVAAAVAIRLVVLWDNHVMDTIGDRFFWPFELLQILYFLNGNAWNAATIACLFVLMLAGPEPMVASKRRTWLLFVAAVVFDLVANLAATAFPQPEWPPGTAFLFNAGQLVIWALPFWYLLRWPSGPPAWTRAAAAGG